MSKCKIRSSSLLAFPEIVSALSSSAFSSSHYLSFLSQLPPPLMLEFLLSPELLPTSEHVLLPHNTPSCWILVCSTDQNSCCHCKCCSSGFCRCCPSDVTDKHASAKLLGLYKSTSVHSFLFWVLTYYPLSLQNAIILHYFNSGNEFYSVLLSRRKQICCTYRDEINDFFLFLLQSYSTSPQFPSY